MRVEKVEQPVVFDTDCLSAFAAFSDGIKIIKETLGDIWTSSHAIDEISESPDNVYLNVRSAEKSSTLGVYKIRAGDSAMELFRELTDPKGKPVMGDGEAAAIALVSVMGGTVASNNLRDIKEYCVDNRIQFICSDDILCLAVQRQVIDLKLASLIWDTMKKKRFAILPKYDFREALRRFLSAEDR
jgi:hypothetical protein